MNVVLKSWFFLGFILLLSWLFLLPELMFAKNIINYKDLISDSRPNNTSNHTLSFKLMTDVSSGGYIEITPPTGFEIIGTSTFSGDRNVELYVNGSLRTSSATGGGDDLVEIFPGSPGLIRYTLNGSSGISAGSNLELKIGNHTSKANEFSMEYSTTTATTTITEADIKPIINSSATGTKKVAVRVYDGGLIADADFSIAIIEAITAGPADTTEEIPPFRFNGAPANSITGVTLNVEIFVETDEFAVCKFALEPDVHFHSMPFTFSGTGLIYHTHVVPVTPNSLQTFYVRCTDDQGNYNIDDYLIQFSVSEIPTGSSNTEGDVDGDGTGTGNDGTGSGSGSGGTSGSSDGEAPTLGGSAGGGGSGGGSGGGVGGSAGGTAGGGFESSDAPYQSGDGRVIISGRAFPNAEIISLVDGKESEKARADSEGRYSVTIDMIARGVYTFGVYAVDRDNVKSSTFSTSFTVTGARTSSLSNINITPTIKVSPDPVDPGQTLTISGYALPNAEVTIENMRDGTTAGARTLTATSNNLGLWSTTMDTTGLQTGTYKVRARAVSTDGSHSTNFSAYTLYGIGQQAERPRSADLNRDGKVNLIDFSILLFWWNTDGGNSNPSADINGDGRVNLTDFSILLFNWTG